MAIEKIDFIKGMDRDAFFALYRKTQLESEKRAKLRDKDAEIKRVEESLWYFATNYIVTFDEESNSRSRFPAYPYIRDTVFPEILSHGNKLWEKSQRMVITISFTVAFYWMWLTWPSFAGWMTSRKRQSIKDKGPTWKSLFGKLRLYYREMVREGNGWLIEHYIGSVPNADRLFTGESIENPGNGNTIIGEAPTPGAGTGEGYTKALIDEAAIVPNAFDIIGNLSLACPKGVHLVSYPNGMNNAFAKIRHDFERNHNGFKVVTIPYLVRPDHSIETMNAERKKMSKRDFARRIEISYSESTEGKLITEFVESVHVNDEIKMNSENVILCFDFGWTDSTSVGFLMLGWIERYEGRVPVIVIPAWFEVNKTKYSDIALGVKEILLENGFMSGVNILNATKGSEFYDERKSKLLNDKTIKLDAWGDPQVNAASISDGVTLGMAYKSVGFKIQASPRYETRLVVDEINDWLKDNRIFIHPSARPIVESFKYASWPLDKMNNVKSGATQPAHDQYSHAFKAFEYGFRAILEKIGWDIEKLQDDNIVELDIYERSIRDVIDI